MASSEDQEILLSKDKISFDTETTDRNLDIESGIIPELNQPAPGMWLFQTDSKDCCIYRVPNCIRQINPEAYTPQLLIVGPLHYPLISKALKSHGDITNTKSMGYLNMERQKKFYLAEFTRRLEGEQTIEGLRRIVEEEEQMIRACYSESTAWIESSQFIDMILYDSIFIIEFIFRIFENLVYNLVTRKIFMKEPSHAEGSHGGASQGRASPAESSHGGASQGKDSPAETSYGRASQRKASPAETSHAETSHGGVSEGGASHAEASSEEFYHFMSFWVGKLFMGEPLMDEPCLYNTVINDLSLLENQLPYVILEKLSDGIVSKLFPDQTFRKLVIQLFLIDEGKISDDSCFRHFTDLIRLIHVETLPKDLRKVYDKPTEHTYTASKLYSGGVEFEAVKENFSLNVRYDKGCLKMTCLRVDDKVEMRLRNVMALEQCHYPFNTHVCNYVNFLDCLIDTHKDVELLVEKGIIKNYIGQDDMVAEMVNKLGLGMMVYSSYHSDIAVQVKDYYNNPINRSVTLLKRVYFANLWTGTATVAATFLLVMTLIQTVASIIQIKK